MNTGTTRLLAISAAAWCTVSSLGQEIESLGPWLPPLSTPTNATFGTRMACNGDWLAIASDHEVPNVYGEGMVHLYERTSESWEPRQTITAPDGFDGNHFGLPVVLGEERLIIGSPTDDDLGSWAGAAYIYKLTRGSWTLEQKVFPPNWVNSVYSLFGHAASFGINEDEILIGAFNESTEGAFSGAAYAFRLHQGTWEFTQRFIAPGTPSGTQFGTSIAVANGVLAIGMYGYRFPDASYPQGGVAIYTREREESIWSSAGYIYPENPQPFQGFGQWVDLNDDTLVVCSSSEDVDEQTEGVIHIYDMVESFPLLNTTIDAPMSGAQSFSFPSVLSQDGSKIFIGAANAAWIFQKIDGTWGSPVRLIPSQPAQGALFGLSAVFDGDEVFVGAPRHPLAGENAGAVFRFLLTDCNETDVLDVWELHAGISADGNVDDIPDECQDQPCDLNFDGKVNGADLGYLFGLWGTDGSNGADFDASGRVDAGDLGLVLASWTP